MARKKVTLAYITNDSERKASFKKRKKGLIKKVAELSTLCGVEACAIIYSPYDAEPEVWPDVLRAQKVLARFRKLSEMDQSRKMVNQESFTRQRIKKVEDQFRRLHRENQRREMENFMFECLAGMSGVDDFNFGDSGDMGWVVNQILRDIRSKLEVPPGRIQHCRHHDDHQVAAAAAAAPDAYVPLPPEPVVPEVAAAPGDDLEGFPWNLVQSLLSGGCEEGGLGWDEGMVLPYPYIFDHGNEPGNGGI